MENGLARHLNYKRLTLSTRKGSGHTRLDSLCKHTAEDFEFLDTAAYVDVMTIYHARIQNYNDSAHCECMTNYGFTHVNCVRMSLM